MQMLCRCWTNSNFVRVLRADWKISQTFPSLAIAQPIYLWDYPRGLQACGRIDLYWMCSFLSSYLLFRAKASECTASASYLQLSRWCPVQCSVQTLSLFSTRSHVTFHRRVWSARQVPPCLSQGLKVLSWLRPSRDPPRSWTAILKGCEASSVRSFLRQYPSYRPLRCKGRAGEL